MNLEPSSQLNLYAIGNYLLDLSKLHSSEKFPNKILLSGEKGIGKSTLAYHLINFILSEDEEFSYDMKNLKIVKATTESGFKRNNFIYNFMSSMRQKLNDPLNKRVENQKKISQR